MYVLKLLPIPLTPNLRPDRNLAPKSPPQNSSLHHFLTASLPPSVLRPSSFSLSINPLQSRNPLTSNQAPTMAIPMKIGKTIACGNPFPNSGSIALLPGYKIALKPVIQYKVPVIAAVIILSHVILLFILDSGVSGACSFFSDFNLDSAVEVTEKRQV